MACSALQLSSCAGGFDESLAFWQETELVIRVCQIARVDAVDEPLMVLRLNTADPGRLTNKYDGWAAAVEQINAKHADLTRRSRPRTGATASSWSCATRSCASSSAACAPSSAGPCAASGASPAAPKIS